MIQTRSIDSAVILDLPSVVEGEALQGEIQRVIATGCNQVVVNLTNITFIESAGLGALVSVYKYCDANQKPVAFHGVQPYVAQLMNLTKLNNVLATYPDEQAALAALATLGK